MHDLAGKGPVRQKNDNEIQALQESSEIEDLVALQVAFQMLQFFWADIAY